MEVCKMKQIIALLVLSLFLFSITPVDARQERNEEWEKNMIQNYQQSIEKYKNIREEWENEKNEFEQAKEKLKRFDRLNDNEKANTTERISNFLLKTLDRMDSHLDILESWAEKVNITEERRTQILEDIADKREEIDGFRSEIEGATTVEELRAISKDIKESWKGFVPSIKRISGELLTERIGEIIETSEELSVKMHNQLDNLSQNESEVQDMQELLDQYDEHIRLAREKYELAMDTYEQIDNNTNASNMFEQTKEYLSEAREQLKEAHQILKELVKDYREFTNVAIIDDEDDDENETENETDDDLDDENETEEDSEDENETDDDLNDENESEENESED
nr:hypothetical protein [Nanoarchaeum sp.]